MRTRDISVFNSWRFPTVFGGQAFQIEFRQVRSCSSCGKYASMTFPTAVQCNGTGHRSRKDAQRFGGIQLLDVNGRQSVAHGEVNGFASLLVQFPKVRQTESPDIKLPCRRLPDGKTRDAEVVIPSTSRLRKSRGHQVCKEAITVLTGSRDSDATCFAVSPRGIR